MTGDLTVRWPDGTDELWPDLPSALLVPDAVYPVAEVVDRARTGLMQASARVARQWGFPCPVAAAQLARIEEHAAAFHPDAQVRVLRRP